MNIDSEFISSIKQIMDEKGIPEGDVYSTIEAALAAAYRKEYGKGDDRIEAKLEKKSGKVKYYKLFEVVEELENENNQISLKDAKKTKGGKKKDVGDYIKKPLKSKENFGRIAAQTAKQVVIQRLREAERETIYQEFKEKEGTLLNGVIQQIEGRNVILDMGKVSGVIFPPDQVPEERYYIGQRLRVYIVRIEKTPKGPVIALSRSHPGLIERLFELEVPEIKEDIVKIRNVVREAGKRTKIAVSSKEKGVDPVGSCVGQRGTRVQAVLAEIGGEKIDIVLYDKDPQVFIKNALSPAKILEAVIERKAEQPEKEEGVRKAPFGGRAKVTVSEDQLSLAIGKAGQNVRLASRLTGYDIDIVKEEDNKNDPAESSADHSGGPASNAPQSGVLGGEKTKKDTKEEKAKSKKEKTKTKKKTDKKKSAKVKKGSKSKTKNQKSE